MHKNVARIARTLTALTLGIGISASCLAQAWPNKTVTVVVPWPAGGPSDTAAWGRCAHRSRSCATTVRPPLGARTTTAPVGAEPARGQRYRVVLGGTP